MKKVLKINNSKTKNATKLSNQICNVVSILCDRYNINIKSFQFGLINNDYAIGKITLMLTFHELT